MHTCFPNLNAKTYEQTRRGVQGGGRKGAGEGERGREGRTGEGRKGGVRREKGGGRREKRGGGEERKGEGEGRNGPPCTHLYKHIIRNGPT